MKLNLVTLYTVKEYCSLLKIGRNKMMELIWNQAIEAFKIGRQCRVSERTVQEYIQYHR